MWDGCVSSTLDFARQMLVAAFEGQVETDRRQIVLRDAQPPLQRARAIAALGAEVVICGAVSRALAHALGQAGVVLIPHVAGDVDEVLAAYLCGRLSQPCYRQAGCGPGAGRRRRRGHGRCVGF
jgi:predicted Fe-Mo cluster-binding NifX family protein